MKRLAGFLIFTFLAIVLMGCFTNTETPSASTTPTPANQLVYDIPVVTLSIKNGTTLPGTNLGYSGKSATGAANLLIGGQVAPKQTADAVDWQGTPIQNVAVKLNTRVATFDDQAITLVGTAHIVISNIKITSGGAPGTSMLEFSAPVTFALKKDELVPGSILAYAGQTADGAKFLGIEGYPYRKQFDSLQYVGRLAPKVFLKLDLRVASFSDTGATLGGTATIRLEQ